MATAAVRGKLSFKTLVVHSIMVAVYVGPAWALMERGVVSSYPHVCSIQSSTPETILD